MVLGEGAEPETREGMVQSYLTNGLLIVEYQPNINYQPTQRQLLPGVRGQREAQHRHGGDQEARHDQVGEVVEGPPSDLDVKGDVKIRLGTAVVNDFIPISRNSWKQGEQGYKVNHEVFFCRETGILDILL